MALGVIVDGFDTCVMIIALEGIGLPSVRWIQGCFSPWDGNIGNCCSVPITNRISNLNSAHNPTR